MKTLLFLRRKGLGAGSIRGMLSYMSGFTYAPQNISVKHSMFKIGETQIGVVRNDFFTEFEPETTMLIRWGCTTATGVPLSNQLNPSQSIKSVADKLRCRDHLLQNLPTFTPITVSSETLNLERGPSVTGSLVLRPRYHHQGRNLFVCNGLQEVLQIVGSNPAVFSSGWYASELVDKVAEYRVYVVNGRVVTVARKTPDDPSQVAWNVAQGGRFDVVRWGEWPMQVCEAAVKAHNLVDGLDFSGVDVMVSRDGQPYILELNSAPSLPLLSSGEVSYRQKVMATAFLHMFENGRGLPEPSFNDWRECIHPAVL